MERGKEKRSPGPPLLWDRRPSQRSNCRQRESEGIGTRSGPGRGYSQSRTCQCQWKPEMEDCSPHTTQSRRRRDPESRAWQALHNPSSKMRLSAFRSYSFQPSLPSSSAFLPSSPPSQTANEALILHLLNIRVVASSMTHIHITHSEPLIHLFSVAIV